MAKAGQPEQAGFTLIELMITVAIVGILAGIALGQWRDYTRRARMSEVVLATTDCKTRIAESYLTLTAPPTSGAVWGCDSTNPTQYVSAVQASADGVIRVTIGHLDPAVNGLYMHLVPMHADGTTQQTGADLGSGVGQWLCGSNAQQVRNALPSNCRNDTSPYASAAFY